MPTDDEILDRLDGLEERLDRIERLIRGQVAAVPDDTLFSYEEAAIYFVTARNPHWLSDEEVERARGLLSEHQMSPRKMAGLCKDETCRFPYRVKVGQSAIVPASAVKRYKERLFSDDVKARHRVQ